MKVPNCSLDVTYTGNLLTRRIRKLVDMYREVWSAERHFSCWLGFLMAATFSQVLGVFFQDQEQPCSALFTMTVKESTGRIA